MAKGMPPLGQYFARRREKKGRRADGGPQKGGDHGPSCSSHLSSHLQISSFLGGQTWAP